MDGVGWGESGANGGWDGYDIMTARFSSLWLRISGLMSYPSHRTQPAGPRSPSVPPLHSSTSVPSVPLRGVWRESK